MLRLLGLLALGKMIFGDARHRRNGNLLGSFFILPALIFGGWVAMAVVGVVLSLIGTIIGGIFAGLSSLASGVFSGSGVVIGIVIGLILFSWLKKRNAPQEKEESGSTVDGEAVETEIVEPKYHHMNG